VAVESQFDNEALTGGNELVENEAFLQKYCSRKASEDWRDVHQHHGIGIR
jgi:hypothetical protein